MGMFDTIQWGDNLPFSGEMKVLGLDKNNWSFQTKDLHCCLDTYIVQDGHLFLQKYKDQSWVEGDPKAESLMDRMGFLKRVDPYLEAQKGLTETICMYDYRQDVDGLWDCTIDFKVVFVYGMVESVELTKFDKRSNSERKQQELEWKKELEYHNSLWYNRFIFHTPPYLWVRKHLSRALYKTGSFLHTISYQLP